MTILRSRRHSRSASILVTFAVMRAALLAALAGAAESRDGLIVLQDEPLEKPQEVTQAPIPGADFEQGEDWPASIIAYPDREIVAGEDAPQGDRYGRITLKADARVIVRDMPAAPGQPHLLSLWIKTPPVAAAKSSSAAWATINFSGSEPIRTFGAHYPGLPRSGGGWRYLAYYFLMPAQAETVTYHIHFRGDDVQSGIEDQAFCFDDIQLRTASWDELSAAYQRERQRYAEYDNSPVADGGRNLALSVAKWQGHLGLPGKPFVIWAIGSSWTNFQGNGLPLILAIRERFPDAPPIVYKKHAGSGTPWDFAAGWARHLVAPDQPDLVLTYTNGTPEGLENLLTEVRRQTTADILVGSLHFFQRDTLAGLTDEFVEHKYEDWAQVREICRRHQAEFVENRRALADYLRKHQIEPSELVGDAVHQNGHGRTRIWDNIVRHVAEHSDPSYDPHERERRVDARAALDTENEHVHLQGSWRKTHQGLATNEAGASLTLRFTGSRVDLIGRRQPGGGRVRVMIDGRPADEAPAWAVTFIQPDRDNKRLLAGPGTGDVAPHAVALGENVVPQSWTITMTSDTGDFQLTGSVTGDDGQGNALEPFTSNSKQIMIDPAMWRHTRIDKRSGDPVYGNARGDTFTFDVRRMVQSCVAFDTAGTSEALNTPDNDGLFTETLAQQLPNGPHTVQLIVAGDADGQPDSGLPGGVDPARVVVVDSLYVFQPPLK